MKNQPTAMALKERLWLALDGVQTGRMTTETANAIATQSREIVRIIKVELEIKKQMVEPVNKATAAFVE